MISNQSTVKAKISHHFYSEITLLILPTLYIAGITLFNINNWHATLYEEYIRFVERAQNFHWVDPFYPLGYTAVIKGLFYILKDYLLVGKVVSAASSFAVIFLMAKIASMVHSRRAGILAQLFLLSKSNHFFWLSHSEGTDMLSVAMLFISIYYLMKNNEKSLKLAALCGAFIGFAYLIRYPNLLFAIIMALWFMLYGKDMRINMKLMGTFILFFFLTASIQLVPSALQTGNPFYNQFEQNIYYSVYGQGNFTANWGSYHGSFYHLLKNDFMAFANNYFNNLSRETRMVQLFLVPAFIGFILAIINIKTDVLIRKKILLLFALPLCFMLSTSLAFTDSRHLLPIFPLLCILIGILGDKILNLAYGILNKFIKFRSIDYICVILIVFFLFSYAKKTTHIRGVDWNRNISDILISNGMESPSTVLTSSSTLYFHYSKILERYSHIQWGKDRNYFRKNRNIGFLEFEQFILKKGYKFVIFEESEGLKFLTNMEDLFHEKKLPEYWELIYNTTKSRFVIYKINYGMSKQSKI